MPDSPRQKTQTPQTTRFKLQPIASASHQELISPPLQLESIVHNKRPPLQIAPPINFNKGVRLTSNELDYKPEKLWKDLQWNVLSTDDYRPNLVKDTRRKLKDLIANMPQSQRHSQVVKTLTNMNQFDVSTMLARSSQPRKQKQPTSCKNSETLKDTFKNFEQT